MNLEHVNVYRRELDDGLVLRTLASVEDIERLAEFHAGNHGPGVGPFVRNLLYNRPHMTPDDQVLVETARGEVISALCLIPWKWNMDGALLDVGELGVVATDEAYRRRGLIREQMVYFMDRLNTQGYVLSHIQGIPHYYRQFGYDYALPLDGGYLLELRNIIEADQGDLAIRRASASDINALMNLYAESVQSLNISTIRDKDIWRYLLSSDNDADDMVHDTWICESNDGAALGYMRIPHHHFGEELVIDEAQARNHQTAMAMLMQAKTLATERKKPGIRLALPCSNYLVRLSLALGGRSMGAYAWQIHVPDKMRLLRAIRPALERRLQSTPFSSWSTPLEISFYTDAITIQFELGRVASVEPSKPAGSVSVKMPPDAFMPLVLGYRSVQDTHDAYPDFTVKNELKPLVETLFPKRESYIFTSY